MPKKQYCYDYPRPAVTVDVVIVTREKRPRVLLIQRKHDPFAGAWAIPGGFVDMEETLETAARRELMEETGVKVARIEQVATFGDPGRDPRGRTISVIYLARVKASEVTPKAGDDAANAQWHFLDRLPKLAFDHKDVLKLVRRRIDTQARR